MSGSNATTMDVRYDVAIVGLGPVGQSLALLLAQRGHQVLVIEKQNEPYPLPRAVHYDPDVSRLLDTMKLSEYMAEYAIATRSYEWQNARRETLLRFEYNDVGDQGWPESSMFNQPGLERAMRDCTKSFDNITIHRGTTLVGMRQFDGGVSLEITSRTLKHKRLTARYLIGADGSNSTVRQYMETSVQDLGFFYEWLIVDLLPRVERTWEPSNLQICDPNRPTSAVEGGPGRRRFEFMRMPDDDLAEFDSDEMAWNLLESWGITPETDVLERRALYTFQARWATHWRDGRVFLAGDAAHQMPPFYGQGMVSGMRDAANLAWKLDFVLRGVAADDLLDTYDSERSVHVRHAIGMSVELGKIICQVNADEVSARDRRMLELGPSPENVLPPMPPERLGSGAFVDDLETSQVAGLISVQGRLGHRTTTGAEVSDLADRLWPQTTLVPLDGRRVSQEAALELEGSLPASAEAHVVRVLPKGSDLSSLTVLNATDDDGVYLRLFDRTGLVGVVVRPDYFYAGGLQADDKFEDLAEKLISAYQLTASSQAR